MLRRRSSRSSDARVKGRGRRPGGVAATAALVLAASLLPVASVAAVEPTDEPTNMVLVWNENAVNILSTPATAVPPGLGQGPPLSPLHLAMVQGAIYDAVNAIDGGHEPYLGGLSAPSTASKAAAVAQAAHDVLYGLTSTSQTTVRDRIDDMLDASLLMIPDRPSKAAGIQIGAQAAAEMLRVRSTDGRNVTGALWDVGTAPGKWRPVAPLNNHVAAHFGDVTPLTLKSADQFPTAGPPPIRSLRYALEFYEVKRLGSQTGSRRTEAQTSLAGFVGANPVPYMNRGLREIAVARGLTTVQQARLFVMTSMASADALIACFDDKDHWDFWRPQTAIREAATDGNPLTRADSSWLSLFATPGYPDQSSGYNCYTAGVWQSARAFFGTDKMAFQLTSPGVAANATAGNPVGVAGSTRNYTRFSDVIRDTVEGRILTGFHFRTADVAGAWIGKKAAQWVDKHYFEPID